MRSRIAASAVLLAFGLVGLSIPAASQAGGLYKWVDKRGVIHFTDEPKHGGYRAMANPRGITIHAFRQNRSFDSLIMSASTLYGVPAPLVKAVIAAESAFNPGAVSPKGAMGLMQLMPATADELGVRAPFTADDNVHGGTRYLSQLHERYQDWKLTLAAYNAGPTAVDRFEGIPPYPETRGYVKRVLSYYRRFHDDFPR